MSTGMSYFGYVYFLYISRLLEITRNLKILNEIVYYRLQSLKIGR